MDRVVHVGEFCEHYKICRSVQKRFGIEAKTERISKEEFEYLRDLWDKTSVAAGEGPLVQGSLDSDTLQESATEGDQQLLITSTDCLDNSTQLDSLVNSMHAANKLGKKRDEHSFQETLLNCSILAEPQEHSIKEVDDMTANKNGASLNTVEQILLETSSDYLETRGRTIITSDFDNHIPQINGYESVTHSHSHSHDIIESSPAAFIIETSES